MFQRVIRTFFFFRSFFFFVSQLCVHVILILIGEGETSSWEGCDSSMELLIALEMSRLQMIEDEARRRLSWLQEHSREHGWDGTGDARAVQGTKLWLRDYVLVMLTDVVSCQCILYNLYLGNRKEIANKKLSITDIQQPVVYNLS